MSSKTYNLPQMEVQMYKIAERAKNRSLKPEYWNPLKGKKNIFIKENTCDTMLNQNIKLQQSEQEHVKSQGNNPTFMQAR